MEVDRTPGIQPRLTLWRQFDAFGRHSFPALGTMLGMLAIAAPLDLPGQAELLPGFALAAVFFWTVFRPSAMPPAVVFMLGVFADLLGFAPLGVRVLILLFTYGLALRWRRRLAHQQFAVVWLAFIAVAAGAAGLEWSLDSLLALRILPLMPALFQFALASGLYPPLAAGLTRAHRGIAAWERA